MLRIICLILLINFVLALDGPNVCIDEKEIPTVVKVAAKVPQVTKTFKWCLSKFPPRCEVTKIVHVDGYKEEIHYQKNQTRVCCKGYAEARNKCIAVCSNPCLHGTCVSAEKCECEPGWTGLNCAFRCVNNSDSNSTEPVLCDHISGGKVWSSASLKILDTIESVSIDGANTSSTTTSTALVLLIGMIIIVLLISGFLILKYRRKLQLLNSELAFVTYISRKESNDRFDNPLYSYQATDYKPPLSPSGQSPPSLPPQQASSSSFLSTKSALLSGFNRSPELVSSSSSSCKANEKLSDLPNDFLKPLHSSPSCYEDLKTNKREYNSNIYEDGDNHCGSKFLPPTIPPPSPSPSLTTSTKEPVYAEIPGSRSFNSDNSDDEDLKENQYDVPRPINLPNNSQVNNKLDNLN